jgi:hypothetical protein
VATGFATDWCGEMEISAWEIGAGLGELRRRIGLPLEGLAR